MKRYLLTGLLLATTSYGIAQHTLQQASAFYTITIPGTQRVDENGNKINPPPAVARFILMACKYNGRPKIDSVWINNTAYPAALADAEEKGTNVGTNAATGKPVFFIPKKGTHTWKIFVNTDQTPSLKPDKLKKIVVKGYAGKTPFSYTLTSETQLTVPDSY